MPSASTSPSDVSLSASQADLALACWANILSTPSAIGVSALRQSNSSVSAVVSLEGWPDPKSAVAFRLSAGALGPATRSEGEDEVGTGSNAGVTLPALANLTVSAIPSANFTLLGPVDDEEGSDCTTALADAIFPNPSGI